MSWKNKSDCKSSKWLNALSNAMLILFIIAYTLSFFAMALKMWLDLFADY